MPDRIKDTFRFVCRCGRKWASKPERCTGQVVVADHLFEEATEATYTDTKWLITTAKGCAFEAKQSGNVYRARLLEALAAEIERLTLIENRAKEEAALKGGLSSESCWRSYAGERILNG